MKKILFALTFLFFISCADNEENIDATTSDFVGTWNLTSFNGLAEGTTTGTFDNIVYTASNQSYGKDFDMTFTFSENPNEYTSNGSFTSVVEYEDSNSGGPQINEDLITAEKSFDSGTWSIDNDKFFLENGFEDEIEIPSEIDLDLINGLSIKSITDTKIVLEEEVSEIFSGDEISYEINVKITVVLER